MPAVRIQLSGHPKYPLVVVWDEAGKERRKYAKCQRAAAAFKRKKEAELAHVLPSEGPATPDEYRAVLQARAHRVPLMEAVEHWRETIGKANGVTVADLCERRLGETSGENHSGRHRASLQSILPRIGSSSLGAVKVGVLTAEQVADYLRERGTPSTQRYYRAILSGVFKSAMLAGLMTWNPASLIKPPRSSSAPPQVFSIDDACRWLACVAAESPAILAGTAIGMFAGLRVAEVDRLDWSEVKMERGFIEVTAAKAKTRTRRLVDIMPNLHAILEPLAAKSGPIMPHTVKRHKERAVRSYGQAVPQNVARHSFVSYHLALFEDVAKTELQAGHDRAVLFGHYRELVTQDEAEEYFTISV